MPKDYTTAQMMADIMNVVKDNMPYIVPAAIFTAVVAFVIRWFMYSVDIGSWAFGKRK